MSVPPANDDDLPTDAAKGRKRPPGEQGGHTVQDWEQPTPTPFVKGDSSSRSTPPPPEQVASKTATVLGDEPSPVVEPIYLRSVAAPPLAKVDAPVHGKSEPLSPTGTETLVDAITNTVSGLMEQSLRESVLAAVRALAPRMIITFPAAGEQLKGVPASVRPPRFANRGQTTGQAAEPVRVETAPDSAEATEETAPVTSPMNEPTPAPDETSGRTT